MPQTISQHIFVIDDDPQIRALLKEYLAANGLRVSVASTGEEMSKLLSDEAVDLVVLDLRLANCCASRYRKRTSRSVSGDFCRAERVTSRF